MTSTRKPSAGFWITVALAVVLVGYPLSFGPACWLVDCGLIRDARVIRWYRPLIRAVAYDWPVAARALNWYGDLFASRTRWITALASMCETVSILDDSHELAETGRVAKRHRRKF